MRLLRLRLADCFSQPARRESRMNIFTKDCACGETFFGPREGGKARGRWLGYDQCPKCRSAALAEEASERTRHER
jgi:hypothetical protein